jgi:modulator of FtsH protease
MFNRNMSATSVAMTPRVQYADKSAMLSFLKTTYQLFAGSLLAGATGAYVGLGFASTISSWFWPLVILEFVLLFAAFKLKEKPVINLAVLFAFTFVSGLTIVPLLTNILHMSNGGSIVAQSFLMTSVAFAGISVFALTTKRDFSSMGKMLFISLIVLIVAMVINIFTQSTMFQLAISSVGAILFSAFILYDTQQIVKGAYATPIEAAISLYLDFLNLFISLLQIFGILGSDD